MRERRLLDLAVGVYVSLLCVTASALLQWEAVAPEFSVERAGVIGLAIAAVVTLVAGTVQDLAEKVTSWPVIVSIPGLPLGYFVYLLFVPEQGSLQALIAGAGALGGVLGAAIIAVGSRITNRRLREASTEIASVTVGMYEQTNINPWLQLGKNVLAFSFPILLIGTTAIVGPKKSVEMGIYGGIMIPVFLGLNLFKYRANDDSWKLTVTNMGVAIDQYTDGSHGRSFNQWADLDGYRVTDDGVELVRSKWYQLTLDFEREKISDEEALIEGLGEFLPRLDQQGRVERSPIQGRQ